MIKINIVQANENRACARANTVNTRVQTRFETGDPSPDQFF